MRKLLWVFKSAGLRFSEHGDTFLAQALAFTAIFAIFPLAILAFGVLGSVYGAGEGRRHLLDLVSKAAPGLQPILDANLQHVVAFRGISGAIALVALVWSGKNLFQGLGYALNLTLGVKKGRNFITDILVSIVMLPIAGSIVVAATLVPIGLSIVAQAGKIPVGGVGLQLAGYAASVLAIFVVTVLLYDYLPNRKVHVGFGVPGAIVTTIGWEVAQVAFAFYSTHTNFTLVYGAVAGVAIVLVWFYYMAAIFLFGAELSAQWMAYDTDAVAGRSVADAPRSRRSADQPEASLSSSP
jgi:membrane protein